MAEVKGNEAEIKVKRSAGRVRSRKKKTDHHHHHHQEIKAKERKRDGPEPRTQDFSPNWRTLVQMLQSEQSSNPKKQNKVTPRPETNKPEQGPKQPDGTGEKRHDPDRSRTGSTVRGRGGARRKKTEGGRAATLSEADIWFDDVDPDDIEATVGAAAADIARKRSGVVKMDGDSAQKRTENMLVKETACDGLTRAVAIDCEMVGVGPDGEDSILARVSIVNYFGKCVYDKYVKPTERVTDYRTHVSGIRPEDIRDGENFRTVQMEVAQIIQGRILVGHAIRNDLKILLLDHPKKQIRDTQRYAPFKAISGSTRPALRVLCQKVLNVKVQQGEHSSVQDAQATMRLYTLVKRKWEAELKASKGPTNKSLKSKGGKPDPETAQ